MIKRNIFYLLISLFCVLSNSNFLNSRIYIHNYTNFTLDKFDARCQNCGGDEVGKTLKPTEAFWVDCHCSRSPVKFYQNGRIIPNSISSNIDIQDSGTSHICLRYNGKSISYGSCMHKPD